MSADISSVSSAPIHALTGLRAFAALWVVLLHSTFGKINDYPYFPAFDHKVDWGIFSPIVGTGHFAVDLFFILSGFIITHVYGEQFRNSISRTSLTSFYLRRLGRIYAVHLFITLLLAGVYVAGVWHPDRPLDARQVGLSVFLLNVFENPSVNMPAWSVSAEAFAYLVFPFIIGPLMFIRNRRTLLILVFALSLLYGVGIEVFFDYLWHYGTGALFRVMSGFVIGCLLYGLYCQRAFIFKEGHGNDVICALLLCLLFFVMSMRLPATFIYPLLPLFIYFLASSRSFMVWLLGNRVCVYLGMISYSIYMVHYPVLEILRYFFNDYFAAMGADYSQAFVRLFLAFIIICVIAAAAACYHLIEAPVRAVSHRWIKE